MKRAKAISKVEYAKMKGTAYINEPNEVPYVLHYDAFTNQYSLRYKDGLHWQTLICTWDRKKIIDLLES